MPGLIEGEAAGDRYSLVLASLITRHGNHPKGTGS
jgi:hypothetical protein